MSKERRNLFLLLAGAALLRFWNLDHGFPDWWSRPDEANITTRVLKMWASGSWSPGWFEYPSLWIYLLAAVYGVVYALGDWASRDAFVAAYVADPTPWILAARVIAASCGVATVAVVVRLGRGLGGDRVGWLAGLVLALAPLHVRDSHFGVTDVPTGLVVALALLSIHRIGASPDRRGAWAAGAWVGLAAAVKYNAVLVAVAVPIALFFRGAGRIESPGRDGGVNALDAIAWRPALEQLLCAAVAAAGLFLLLNPYILLDWNTFLEDFGFQARHMQDGHGVDLGRGWLHHGRFSLLHGLTFPVLGLAVVGAGLSIRRGHRWWPLLAYAIVFYLVMGRSRTVFMRYMLPLFPVLCLWAGLALDRLMGRLTSGVLQAAAVAVFLAPAMHASASYLWIVGQIDTREEARSWLLDNAKPGDRILFVGGHGAAYGEPRLRGLEWCQILTLEQDSPHCSQAGPFSTFRMTDQRDGLAGVPEVEWIVAHDHALFLYSSLHYRVASDLQKWGDRSVVFDPRSTGPEGSGGIFDLQDAYFVPVAKFDEVTRPGPYIEIWRAAGPAGSG